jgi:hypothetical protein
MMMIVVFVAALEAGLPAGVGETLGEGFRVHLADALERVSIVRSRRAGSQHAAFTPSTYLAKMLQKYSEGSVGRTRRQSRL